MTPPIPARGDGSVQELRQIISETARKRIEAGGDVDAAVAFTKALDALCALVSTSRAEALEEAARACEAEPELPGEPDDMETLLNDPTQTLRAVVRVTKRNIAAAIRALSSSVPPGNER